MTSYFDGIVRQNEVGAAEGERVYTRKLVVQANTGSLIPIFDPHVLSTDLEIGTRYDLIVTIGLAQGVKLLAQTSSLSHLSSTADLAPTRTSPGNSDTSFTTTASSNFGFTQATVLDTHWWIPDALRPLFPEDATSRSLVLLQTSIGRILASHRYLLRRLGEVRVNTTVTWTYVRLDLVAINGAPYPKNRSTVRHLWPNAEALTMTEPKPLIPALQEALRKHQEWVETGGAQGQRLGLRRADLRGLLLQGVQLRQSMLLTCMLNGSDLRASDLSQADLGGSTMLGVQLDEAVLERMDGKGVILRGASLVRAQAARIMLEDADLTGVNAQKVCLAHAELAGAHLENSHLEGADLRGSNLASAHLSGATLTGAYMQDVFLEGADGIDTVHADWIVVGSEAKPQRLEGAAAQRWLYEAIQRKVRIADH